VEQNLGWQNQRELLDLFSEQMVGVHLHDVIGYSDHKAPGTGQVDFSLLKDYLRRDTLKTIEVFPEVERDELEEGIRFVRRVLD
jgi:sugar phosphate isomerase/epimerase